MTINATKLGPDNLDALRAALKAESLPISDLSEPDRTSNLTTRLLPDLQDLKALVPIASCALS
jgi:hypothetical protein